jgi:hypothetical protein
VETLKKGTSFGAPSLNENVLAKMVIDAVPRYFKSSTPNTKHPTVRWLSTPSPGITNPKPSTPKLETVRFTESGTVPQL